MFKDFKSIDYLTYRLRKRKKRKRDRINERVNLTIKPKDKLTRGYGVLGEGENRMITNSIILQYDFK